MQKSDRGAIVDPAICHSTTALIYNPTSGAARAATCAASGACVVGRFLRLSEPGACRKENDLGPRPFYLDSPRPQLVTMSGG
jgi:hypothetical protein